MAAIGYFDATQVQPGGAFEVVPAGEYRVMISDSAMEASSKGGQFLKLTLQILDGPHAGVTLFDRLNLVNSNPKAVEIAQRTLSAICHAVGVMQVQDSAQLHNRPLVARVTYKDGGEPDGKGGVRGPSNEIKQYKPISQQQTAPPQPAQSAFPPFATPQQQPAGGQPPAQQQPVYQQQPMQPAYQPPVQQQPQQQPVQQQTAPASNVPPWMQQKAA